MRKKPHSRPKKRKNRTLRFFIFAALAIIPFLMASSVASYIKEIKYPLAYDMNKDFYEKDIIAGQLRLKWLFNSIGAILAASAIYQLLLGFVEKSNERGPIVNSEEFYPEIENDPAFIQLLQQVETDEIIGNVEEEKDTIPVETVPQVKTKEQIEREQNEKVYNKKVNFFTKVALSILCLFVIVRVAQSVQNNKVEVKPASTQSAANAQDTTHAYSDAQDTSRRDIIITNYFDYPEQEFLDNKIQHYTSDNKISDFKVNFSLPSSWVIKPPKYSGVINSFIAKNETDIVNYVLSVYELNVTPPNLTQANLSTNEGLKKLFVEMSASFSDKELISTSTNDKIGNYAASSILYSISQSTRDNQTLSSYTKAYYVVRGTKVVCFMETYSDLSKIGAEKTKEKYVELSSLILNSFKIVGD